MKRVIVLGASGLTGMELTKQLLAHPAIASVEIIVRKKIDLQDPKLIQTVIDFEQLAQIKIHADIAYSCLGTTMRNAKTKENYWKIDYGYNETFAQRCKEQGIENFHLQSSMGADEHSKIFYSHLKGKLQNDIAKLNFKYYYIYCPSMLIGPRKEFRLGELIGKFIMKIVEPIMFGPFKKYKSVHVRSVAACMIANSLNPTHEKKYIVDNLEIKKFDS